MAEIPATIIGGKPGGNPPRGTIVVEWFPLVSGDTGAYVELPNYPDKSVMVSGTFGDGTLTLQGTNEKVAGAPANPQTLNDAQGTTLTWTAQRLEQVLENPRYIRPSMSGTTGDAIKVTMICTRTKVPQQG